MGEWLYFPEWQRIRKCSLTWSYSLHWKGHGKGIWRRYFDWLRPNSFLLKKLTWLPPLESNPIPFSGQPDVNICAYSLDFQQQIQDTSKRRRTGKDLNHPLLSVMLPYSVPRCDLFELDDTNYRENISEDVANLCPYIWVHIDSYTFLPMYHFTFWQLKLTMNV